MNDLITDDAAHDVFLPPCPSGGKGVHTWVFQAAKICLGLGLTPADAASQIRRQMSREPNPSQEVSDTVKKVYSTEFDDLPPQIRWPKPFEMSVIGALPAWNPAPPDPVPCAKDALHALFKGDPILCVGGTLKQCYSEALSQFEGLENAQFIVPSPMMAHKGVSKSTGRMSPRALEIVGPRKYLVVECDFTPEDAEAAGKSSQELCLSVLGLLRTYRDLVCVVDSGGKSVHGWFLVTDDDLQDDGKLIRFMQYAVAHGADKKTWTKNQLVRLPGGLRDNGKRQRILFWNPPL